MRSPARIRAILAAMVVGLIGVIALVGAGASTRATKDLLALHGRPPHSAVVAVTLRTGSSLQATGIVTINALTNALSGRLEIPITTAPTTIEVRALNDRLYLTSPNLADASGPVWYSEHLAIPAIARWAHYLVHPNAAILTLLAGATPSQHDGTTTYEFHRRNVSLGRLGVRQVGALSGQLDVRLSVGRQGEVTEVWFSVNAQSQRTSLDLRVLSYNRPAAISAPPASRSTHAASPLLKELFTSGALGSVVVPASLLHPVIPTKVS